MKADVIVDDVNELVMCKGFKIGTIDGLGVSYYEGNANAQPGDDLVQPGAEVNAYGSLTGLSEALWKTLTGNRTPEGRLPPIEKQKSYACLLQCAMPEQAANVGCNQPESTPWRGRQAFNRLMESNRHFKIAGRALGTFFAGSILWSLYPS